MRQTGKRGSSTRVGRRGATLVMIALFSMLLAPALASAIVSSTPTPVASPAPVNTVAPTLTGTPALGQTLTCSTGTWTNSPTSFSYAWLRSGVPIAGQAGSTYAVEAADQGHTVSCQVTAGNGGGNYTISGLATGSYKVGYYPEGVSANYLSQYFNGKLTEAEATPVAVTVPATTEGVNAELHAGGQIAGRVTAAATHAPLGSVEACAEEASAKYDNCAETNSNGEYTISALPSGSYTVEFHTYSFESGYLSQYYNGKSSFGEAQAVGVTAGTTVAGIDAELQSANQGGQISGIVSRALGGTLAGIEVCAYETSEIVFFDSCAVTNSNGEYTISGLPEGSFTVSFSGEDCQSSPCTMENYIFQYYNGVASSTEATQVPVLANTDTPGIDAKMVEGGRVEGRVTSAATGEAPLENVDVCADEGTSGGCDETNSNGEYKIEGLSSGTSYTVYFAAFSGNYLDQTVDNVAVKAGETTHPPVDVKLLVGGQIAGKVADASTHASVADVDVCAERVGGEYAGCAATNVGGEYTISSLSSGSYNVVFTPEGETNYLPQSQSGVSVTAGGTTTNVNAELHGGGQLSGRVTDASTHAGIAGIDVCAEQVEGSSGKCALTTAGSASASATSNALTVPGGGFTLTKTSFDSKANDLDFFFTFPSAGTLKWSLFFKNADVGFADSLGLSLGANGVQADSDSTQALAEAAKKKKKSKSCKKGTIKHHGKCVKVLVPFGSGSQSVPAGTVEVKVHASSKAIKALKAGHTLHVSGTFTFQSAFGGSPVTHTESTVVHLSKKAAKVKKHRKGKGR